MYLKKIRGSILIGMIAFSGAAFSEKTQTIGQYFDQINKVKMETRMNELNAKLLESKQKVTKLQTSEKLNEIETRVKLTTINKKLNDAGFATDSDGGETPRVNASKVLSNKPTPPPVTYFNESNVHFLAIRGDSTDSLSALIKVGSKENWVALGGEVMEGWNLVDISKNMITVASLDGQTKSVSIKGMGY